MMEQKGQQSVESVSISESEVEDIKPINNNDLNDGIATARTAIDGPNLQTE